MSQEIPVDQPRIVNGKKVDCNGAPWIEAGIGRDIIPGCIAPIDWRKVIAKAKDLEKEQEDKDDQSNENMAETGKLVEAPENNATNLKRKNAMVNGSTPKKAKQDATTTVKTALNHVQHLKVKVVGMITAADIEEMNKAIKEINDIQVDGTMGDVVKEVCSIWHRLREKLKVQGMKD